MKENLAENNVEKLNKLRDRADMLASMHSRMADIYVNRYAILFSLTLILSTILVGLTFISEDFVQRSCGVSPDMVKWVIGITSIVNFCIILLLGQFDLHGKATAHQAAVKFYFAIVNKIRGLFESGVEITSVMVEEIYEEYGRTQSIPKIPDGQFLHLKQWHLKKVAISRELDKTPFEPIKSIEKRLREVQSHNPSGD